MQLHCDPAPRSSFRAFAAPAHCPLCDDLMVAPMMSEFVQGGEIRHHWVCEACGTAFHTTLEFSAG